MLTRPRRPGSIRAFLLVLLSLAAGVASWSWSSSLSSDSSAASSSQEEQDDTGVVVSPIVNRQLETSVKAHHWPTTPQSVFCEVLAYHSNPKDPEQQQQRWAYLDRLSVLLGQLYDRTDEDRDRQGTSTSLFDFTWDSARDVALRASSHTTTTTTSQGLLQVALALRAGSPFCETHRSLARQALQEAEQLSALSLHDPVMAVVYPAGQILLPEDMRKFDWTSVIANAESSAFTTSNETAVWEDYLLPGERPRTYSTTSRSDSTLPDQLVILYANFGTTDFIRYYNLFVNLQIPFVVRHLGTVHFEEDQSLASPTTLQGYGVRVDIRNVEYKVFDDRRDRKMEGDGAVNLTAHPESQPGDLLAGVDLDKLGLNEDSDIKLALWQKHEKQQLQSQKVPPVWQRRQLPLQAATVISQAEDPLATLTEISQNLPSVASLLVNVKIPEEMSQVAELMEQDRSLAPGLLYVNGRKLSLDSPSFNVFEILNVIKEEEASLRKLEESMKPYFGAEALKILQNAWIQGERFDAKKKTTEDDISPVSSGSTDKIVRIDVGRGWKNAVVYLNDVEKDPQYARWPRSVKGMLQSMQYGMPPVVRRNMFTILAVIDPVENPSVGVFQLGMQLVQNSYPARVGILWVGQTDVDECRAWLQSQSSLEDGQACPVKPIFTSRPSNKDLELTKASAQAAHRLLIQVIEEYDEEPQIALAFADYVLASIEDHIQGGTDLSMKDLINIYSGMMQAMGISDETSAEESAREALMEPNSKYGHALRFAAEKNLKPGMGFLNGRPVDGSDTNAISKAFGEEQKHIFGLIMKNEITDDSPKSVYAKLLTGDKVYKKVHPLLFGNDGTASTNLLLEHPFGPESLVFPKNDSAEPKALFVAENLINYATPGGIAELKKFLKTLGSFPTSVDSAEGLAQVSVGYRILPSTKEDAQSPLCAVLARASEFDTDSLLTAVEAFEKSQSKMSLDELIESLPGDKTAINSMSCANLKYLSDEWVPRRLIVLNGRCYEASEGSITAEDVDFLLNMEYSRSRALFESLTKYTPSDISLAVDAIGRAAAQLGFDHNKPFARTDIVQTVMDIEKRGGISSNPLHFRISASNSGERNLLSSIAVVLDPVSDASQRVASLLELFSESLGISLDVILSPATLIDGDSVSVAIWYAACFSCLHSPIDRNTENPNHKLLQICRGWQGG